MNHYSLKFRSLISTWLCLIFFILLIIYLGFIEFLQDTSHEQSAVNLLRKPIRSDVFNNVSSLNFKNRIGSYRVKKINDSWVLQEPRVIPAKEKTISKIIESLRKIKIHTVHQYEPINFESFSLDKPVMEIELYTKLDELIEVKIGLINPINNTSYMTVSGHDRIFQTDLIEAELARLELSDFIDSKVFNMEADEIKEFKLFNGKSKKANNILTRIGTGWKTKKYNTIDSNKLHQKLNKILDIKTHMIVDKKDPALKTLLNNYLKNPRYTIEVSLKNSEKIITYKVSYLTKSISELKIEKKQYFIMTASNRPYPYIINKDFFNQFLITYNEIKP